MGRHATRVVALPVALVLLATLDPRDGDATPPGTTEPRTGSTSTSTSHATRAEEAPDPLRVLATASNAFEYRDFAKVVELLLPWVHPPRIADPRVMKQARVLLGISSHVLGRHGAARDEFSQVLLADPDYAMDPFVVPPAVIDTFEGVRREMAVVLAAARQRENPVERPPNDQRLRPKSERPSALVSFIPLGIPQIFVLDQPEWGALWLGLQIVGLAGNIGGFWGARSQRDADGFLPQESVEKFDQFVAAQYIGLGIFGIAWLGSSIQAHLALRARDGPDDGP